MKRLSLRRILALSLSLSVMGAALAATPFSGQLNLARADDAPAAAPSPAKPKYGPLATRLARSHEYFRKADAPDFWALIPYYVPQQDERSCSLATVTMMINGARATRDLGSEDELATQKTLFKKVNSDIWNTGLGPTGRGVTLDQLGSVALASLRTYGFPEAKVEVIHADPSQAGRAKIHQALVENEKSASDFILANFNQGSYTGDAEAGHIAPIGAYDVKSKRVLVLDPDRTWYEPYWVSEDSFFSGMNTLDKESGKTRGLVHIRLK